MFQKGRKREAKGVAIVYFLIGLLILLLILAAIYFVLVELDYSDKIKDPNATVRAYVEMTPEPSADALSPDSSYAPADVDLTATATPTAEPTATPSPTPTIEPTPEPTAIIESLFSTPITSGFTIPSTASENGAIGFTDCYVSQPNDNKVLYLAGYGYINDAAFDGSKAKSYVVVIQKSSNRYFAYPMTMTDGISGLPHSSAVCQNATVCDFEGYIDVSRFKQDIYSLGLIIAYKTEGNDKTQYAYYPFSGDVSFTVLDGQVVTPVSTVDYE